MGKGENSNLKRLDSLITKLMPSIDPELAAREAFPTKDAVQEYELEEYRSSADWQIEKRLRRLKQLEKLRRPDQPNNFLEAKIHRIEGEIVRLDPDAARFIRHHGITGSKEKLSYLVSTL